MTGRVRETSLRRRLLVLLLGVTGAVWIIAAAWSYRDARHEMGEMMDAQLAQSAQLLLAQTGHEIEHVPVNEIPALHRYERRVAFQLWSNHGKMLMLRSESAPAVRLSDHDEGFDDRTIDGRRWRIYSRRDPDGDMLVQVAELTRLRDELAQDVALHLLHPIMFSLPLLGLVIWLAVGRGLAPLERLARDVDERAPEELTELDARGAPVEARPLVRALNALFARIRGTLDRERRFTSDASHELRTPLAAIKLQAQVARGAGTAEQREHALDQVLSGADRATHLVEQLLTLARLDASQAIELHGEVDLADAVQRMAAELRPRAQEKSIAIALLAPDHAPVRGNTTLLGILVRNALDNAIRYTPEGGRVEVHVDRQHGRTRLCVADNGPGIAAGEREQVFERFYRTPGTTETGSGLGLSIARRIADLHDVAITLGEGLDGKGVSFEVTFFS